MTNHTAIIIATILVPGIALIANSEILINEFFTSFEIDPRVAHPEQENVINVRNTGLVQADNVILTLYANGTINDFRDACPEGNMYQMDNKTLVAEFQRLSPVMLCQFVLVVSEPIQFDVAAFTSDHRSTWAPEALPYSVIAVFIILAVILVIEFAVLILLFNWLARDESIHWLEFRLHRNKFKEAKYVCETRKFVLDEYDLRINEIDATVLEIVHSKKKTMNQIRKYSGLTMRQVRYRIWKLKRLELLKESMELDLALSEYFSSKLKDSS